jgi:hypothetical protein
LVMKNGNQRGLFRCLSLLDKLGYYPISANNDRLLYASIKDSLEQMGKSYSGALIRNMCSLYGLSENELFSNYDLFKKMLYTILGEGEANGIIASIKKELLARAILNGSSLTIREMTNPSLSIEDILESIDSAQTLRIIATISPHEHVLFLYDSEDTKEKILSTFFQSNRITCTTCLLSLKPCRRVPATNSITYDKLYEEHRLARFLTKPLEADLAKKWSYWGIKLGLSNNLSNEKPAKVADEDLTYWIGRDLTSELVELEHFIGRHPVGNISVLCGFNISKLADEGLIKVIEDLISCHGHVIIVDNTFRIYSAEPNKVEVPKGKLRGEHS